VSGNPLGQNELIVPPEAFAPESVLREGMEMLHYDMAPIWENFNALTMPPYHSGLHVSQRNYDISCLQRYADRGYTLPAQIEHDIYSFSYTKQFEELYRLVPAQWPSHENQVRLLANRILQRDFPDVDVQAEITRIRDWQSEKRTPIRNVWRFLRAWLSNAKTGKPRVPRREAPVSVAASQFRAESFPPSPEALAENCDRGLAWCRRILNREVAA